MHARVSASPCLADLWKHAMLRSGPRPPSCTLLLTAAWQCHHVFLCPRYPSLWHLFAHFRLSSRRLTTSISNLTPWVESSGARCQTSPSFECLYHEC